MFWEETIAAVSTPPGTGGIGVIRISGPEAVLVADRVFHAAEGSLNVKVIRSITGPSRIRLQEKCWMRYWSC